MSPKAASSLAQAQVKPSHISVDRYFEVSLLLMLATSFITVASTGKLDLISTLGVGSALALKLWSYAQDRVYSLAPRTVTRLSIFYLSFYALDFLIFAPGPEVLDRMLQATVHLVLFTAVIKIFSARTYRDYAYLAALSFMMMLASAILTVGTLYLVCFTLFMMFSISTFISYEIKRSMEAAPRAAEGPHTSSALNRTAIERALMNATIGLAFGIAALASVLFFIIPRFRTGYLTGLGAQRQNITGFSESVNLGDIRKILQSNAVVMRVVVRGDPRRFIGTKWRGVGLTSFDGKHWYNDNTEQIVVQPAFVSEGGERNFSLPQEEGWQNRARRPVEYRIILSPVSTDVLFAAAVPRRLAARARFVNVDQTGSLHDPQHGYQPFGYEVVSDTAVPSADQLRRASRVLPPEMRLLYLRLPQKFNPTIAELARQVAGSVDNPYDRAVALQNYLRNNYGYSLNPSSIESSDPIGSFLFKSKQGYCEYFAAAMVLMLRTLGVPARYVNGFQTGTYNRLGKDFVVRARDAHSWAEVYFPGYGWMTFDPTPPDPNPVPGGDWGALEDYYDAINLFWNEWVIDYDFTHQMQLAREFEQGSRDYQQRYRARLRGVREAAIRLAFRLEGWLMAHKLLVLALMIAIMVGLVVEGKDLSIEQLRFMWAWRFRRSTLMLGAREASLAYDRFLQVMARKGYRKPASQTPREFSDRLADSPISGVVSEFTCLYNSSRFGQVPVSLARLRGLLESLM
jgi:transglutaminase-like putative cysteine protease